MSIETSRVLALPGGTLSIDACVASDRGAVRKVNEDSFFARPPVYLVADGMGGHSFGDRASQSLVATFSALFPHEHSTRPEAVLDAVRQANENIAGIVDAAQTPGTVSGTTLTGIALVEAGDSGVPAWMAFNVGDSRVYSWDGRALVQLTVDHSAVQELVNHGLITPRQAAVHPERNVITRAVGTEFRVETDAWLLPIRGRQIFVACSDGLSKELDDDAIGALLAEHGAAGAGVTDIAQSLVDAALESGGRDNVTVVVVESVYSPANAEISAGSSDDTRPRNTVPRA